MSFVDRPVLVRKTREIATDIELVDWPFLLDAAPLTIMSHFPLTKKLQLRVSLTSKFTTRFFFRTGMQSRYDVEAWQWLIGAMVVCVGTVAEIVHTNPYTRSKKLSRQKRFLITNCQISGIPCDHVWLHACKRIKNLKIGDSVFLTGTLYVYEHSGIKKCGLKFPYRNVMVS